MRAFVFATLLAGCPSSEDCPDLLVEDLRSCVADWLADPDNTQTEAELVEACADAEPLADAYDRWCSSDDADPDVCSMDYEFAWNTLRPGCIEAY